jgi:HEAT repeat protein
MTDAPTARAVAVAGHRGDVDVARAGLCADDAAVRIVALGALERLGVLDDATLAASLGDPVPAVRRRAAELAASHHGVDLGASLEDPDPGVVEVAAWACGERELVADEILDQLVTLATTADEALVRESAAAALGAIGDERGLPAILAACGDKPAVRRRAVLALAPFEGAQVDAAIEHALTDRDWQVRQAAEDLVRARAD